MGKLFDEFKKRFSSAASEYLPGGCETCGYGADDAMNEEDYLELLKEIDEWVEQEFKNARNVSNI